MKLVGKLTQVTQRGKLRVFVFVSNILQVDICLLQSVKSNKNNNVLKIKKDIVGTCNSKKNLV